VVKGFLVKRIGEPWRRLSAGEFTKEMRSSGDFEQKRVKPWKNRRRFRVWFEKKEKDVYRVQYSYEYTAPTSIRKSDTPDTVGETRSWVYTENPDEWETGNKAGDLRNALRDLEERTQLSLKHARLRRIGNLEVEKVDRDEVEGALDTIQRYVKVFGVRSRRNIEYDEKAIKLWKWLV